MYSYTHYISFQSACRVPQNNPQSTPSRRSSPAECSLLGVEHVVFSVFALPSSVFVMMRLFLVLTLCIDLNLCFQNLQPWRKGIKKT